MFLLLPLTAAACFVLGLRARSAWQAAVGTAVAVAALVVVNQIQDAQYSPLDDVVFFALLFGTPAVVGRLLRGRSQLIAELSERADALRTARAEAAAAAVAEERARVAIGVHDALAHRVGEMSLHAGGAARIADDDPERALAALARIEEAGRAALDDIRDVIGVLRAGDPLALGPVEPSADALPDAPARVPAGEAEPRPRRDVQAGAAASRRRHEPAGAAAPPRRRDLAAMIRPAAAAASDVRADVGVAVLVFAAIAIETLTSSKLEGSPVLNLLGVAAMTAPLALRRRAPLPSAVGVFAAAAVMDLALTAPTSLVTPIVLLILPPYSVAAHLPRRAALVGLAVCVAGSAALEPGPETAAIGLAAFVAGRVVRDRSRRAAELDAITTALDRTRDAHAARMRSEERLRIARELHDAVAHSMTVIVLQAGAAQRVWGRDPAAARVAIDALTDVARQTLADLRVTLRGALPDDAPSLDELAARMRPLGLDVHVDRDPLPPGAERVATAIVQEALTNAARHAAPTTVRVRVTNIGEAAHVVVEDDGRQGDPLPGRPVAGTGTGLQGMAERVAAEGGELAYGPSGAGFRVEARLPLREAVVA